MRQLWIDAEASKITIGKEEISDKRGSREKSNKTKTYFCDCIGLLSKKGTTVSYCPECGGELHYISQTKRYVCKSCGLTLTYQELVELREKLRPNFESDEERRKRTRKEYLQWWLSKKK